MPRTLLLMRHGKSGYPAGVADHDRPLASRGVREAGLAGAWLREHGFAVEAVLCSTALRTRETLTCTGVAAPVHFAATLYDATAGDALAEIAEAGDTFGADVATLLVVGHQPAMGEVACGLAGDGSEADARHRVATNFPTSAIAVIEPTGPWSQLGSAPSALRRLVVPR